MSECQLELKNASKPYPRTCQKCWLSKSCANGLRYEQLLERVKYLEELMKLKWQEYTPIMPVENSTKCTTCNMQFEGVTSYVCTNLKCPIFTVVSC